MNRTISISLEQAKGWMCGDNEALKELALTAFNKVELGIVTYKECIDNMDDAILKKASRLSCLNYKLIGVANYLNKLFPGDGLNKYFISGENTETGMSYKGFNILYHKSVQYLGITYFNTLEAVELAIDFLYDTLHDYTSQYGSVVKAN